MNNIKIYNAESKVEERKVNNRLFKKITPLIAGVLLAMGTASAINATNKNQETKTVQTVPIESTANSKNTSKISYSEIIGEIEKEKRANASSTEQQKEEKINYEQIDFDHIKVEDLRKFLNENQNKALDDILVSILTGEKRNEIISNAGEDVRKYIESMNFKTLSENMSQKEEQDFERLKQTLTNEQLKAIETHWIKKGVVAGVVLVGAFVTGVVIAAELELTVAWVGVGVAVWLGLAARTVEETGDAAILGALTFPVAVLITIGAIGVAKFIKEMKKALR